MQTLLNLQVADILRGAGVATLVGRGREALELVPRVEDVVADEEVEDQRPNYTDPNKKVVGVYSDFVPGVIDPAPDLHVVRQECWRRRRMNRGLTVASP